MHWTASPSDRQRSESPPHNRVPLLDPRKLDVINPWSFHTPIRQSFPSKRRSYRKKMRNRFGMFKTHCRWLTGAKTSIASRIPGNSDRF